MRLIRKIDILIFLSFLQRH